MKMPINQVLLFIFALTKQCHKFVNKAMLYCRIARCVVGQHGSSLSTSLVRVERRQRSFDGHRNCVKTGVERGTEFSLFGMGKFGTLSSQIPSRAFSIPARNTPGSEFLSSTIGESFFCHHEIDSVAVACRFQSSMHRVCQAIRVIGRRHELQQRGKSRTSPPAWKLKPGTATFQ